MPLALIPFLLLAVPVTEITLFIMVGKSIGILPTIAIVLATAIAGSLLLRYQGISTLMAIRQEFNAGRVPGNELANGAMIVIAGLLLLTPGFFTDSLGFLLFVPQVRSAIRKFVMSRINVEIAGYPEGFSKPGQTRYDGNRGGNRGGKVVDLDPGEFREHDDNRHKHDPYSGTGKALHHHGDDKY